AFAAATLVVATAVGLRVRLKHTDHLDLSPAARALPKEVAEAAGYEDGPVLVTIEYRIAPARGDEFAQAMEVVRRMRRRGGAGRVRGVGPGGVVARPPPAARAHDGPRPRHQRAGARVPRRRRRPDRAP